MLKIEERLASQQEILDEQVVQETLFKKRPQVDIEIGLEDDLMIEDFDDDFITLTAPKTADSLVLVKKSQKDKDFESEIVNKLVKAMGNEPSD